MTVQCRAGYRRMVGIPRVGGWVYTRWVYHPTYPGWCIYQVGIPATYPRWYIPGWDTHYIP